jgi:hypothetical protein
MKLHTFTIEGEGAAMRVYMDGRPLEGVRSATLHVGAGEVPVVELQMYADIIVDTVITDRITVCR